MDENMSAEDQTAPSKKSAPKPRKQRSLSSRLVGKLFNLAVLIVFSACVYAAWEGWQFLQTPAKTPGIDITIEVTPGSTLLTTAKALQEKGVITDAWKFSLLARIQSKENKIQAGRFLVNTGWLPQEVLDQLVSGRAMLHRVTIPEGLAWWEVGSIMEQAGLCKADDFAKVIHDQAFLAHWGIPFTSAEGFLFPDTYFLPLPTDLDEKAARAAANRMLDTFWVKADAQFWPDGRPDTTTLKKTIILASIVEKETGVPAERTKVAGVYANRMAKSMLLQADPTVIYGLGPEFSGQLLRRHLEDESNPYNTYRKAGLTPGPICSPGAAAIMAAIHPDEHNFLYFVATGRSDGSHTFSNNLQQHNRAVQEYRNTIRRRN